MWTRNKRIEAKEHYGSFFELFSALPSFETERLNLRPLQLTDCAALYALDSDEEICRMSLSNQVHSENQARRSIQRWLEWGRRGQPMPWALLERDSGVWLGTCGVSHVMTQNDSVRVGFSIRREFWNQGYTTEALTVIIDFLFRHSNVNRIEGLCFPENIGSRRVMEKSGMTLEGILRDHIVGHDGIHDSAVHSILRREWEGR